MLRLAAFTTLVLSAGAMFYGHHSAVWVLLSALFSASTLIPAEASVGGTAATSENGTRVIGHPPEDWLLEMYAH